MRNSYFQFKQFTIHQDRCAMKVTTDTCLFGAWVAEELSIQKLKAKNILDIGTGTGLLPLMIAQKNAYIFQEAIEIEEEAYKQANANTFASPWKDNISIICGDVTRFSFPKKYDAIISNPPFYENELQSPNTSKNKAHHSSELTLQHLFALAYNLLAEEGNFFFLLPYKRNEEAEKLLQANNLFIHEKVAVRQSEQHNYFRVLIKGSKQKPVSLLQKEIAICSTPPHYTPEFISLLKDYYLHL